VQYWTEQFPLGPDIIVFAPNESTVAPRRQRRWKTVQCDLVTTIATGLRR
jgi:hypothetical protein